MKFIITTLMFLCSVVSLQAQIVINGKGPVRLINQSTKNAISISYGSLLWADGANVPVPGYSMSTSTDFLNSFGITGDPFSIEKYNLSAGLMIGFDKGISDAFNIKARFYTAKLVTGIIGRIDIETTSDKSRFTQFALYGSYSLTKQMQKRVQFQWLFGPEFLYAQKDLIIKDYVVKEGDQPANYQQKIDVFEASIVTGLGISLRLTNHFELISEGLVGIALPGKGLKTTNSGIGLKHVF